MRKYIISAEFPRRGNVTEMMRKLRISAPRKYCGNDDLHPVYGKWNKSRRPESRVRKVGVISVSEKAGRTEGRKDVKGRK
jgi:hypothetical protein